MTYKRRNPPPQRGGFNGCLVWVVVLIWLVLGALLAYQYWLRPQLSQQIGRQISEQLANGAAPTIPAGETRPSQPGAISPTGIAAGVLPTLVASLPSGPVRITEAQANAYIAANTEKLRPIESATLRFVPGEIQVDLGAFGVTSMARMSVAIQAGKIVAIDPRVDGPLANLIDLRDLITPLEQQLNDELAAQGRRVTDVRIDQGEMVFTVE
ncbi:MAG: hypothetical protein SH847_07110 [Roseiflexaceae bacterium]|nr:hypothetical protein [Roseiflexaceae bacterium]